MKINAIHYRKLVNYFVGNDPNYDFSFIEEVAATGRFEWWTEKICEKTGNVQGWETSSVKVRPIDKFTVAVEAGTRTFEL